MTAAHLRANNLVPEIGTGWSNGAIAIMRATGCRVTTLTLMREQKVLAETRIALAGFMDNIKALLCDYRALLRRGGVYMTKS
jgi:cyclopropane-fatty-acyl-phospholipid synthase